MYLSDVRISAEDCRPSTTKESSSNVVTSSRKARTKYHTISQPLLVFSALNLTISCHSTVRLYMDESMRQSFKRLQ
jgi:hypothetical protein